MLAAATTTTTPTPVKIFAVLFMPGSHTVRLEETPHATRVFRLRGAKNAAILRSLCVDCGIGAASCVGATIVVALLAPPEMLEGGHKGRPYVLIGSGKQQQKDIR